MNPSDWYAALMVFILAQIPCVWGWSSLVASLRAPFWPSVGFVIGQFAATMALCSAAGQEDRSARLAALVVLGTVLTVIWRGHGWLPTAGCATVYYLDLVAYFVWRTRDGHRR